MMGPATGIRASLFSATCSTGDAYSGIAESAGRTTMSDPAAYPPTNRARPAESDGADRDGGGSRATV
jgi:hypothetical protein